MGDIYYLIINPLNSKSLDNYDLNKHIIAIKDEKTLLLLANHIWGMLPRMIPANLRVLLSFLNKLNAPPANFFNCECVDFTRRIRNIVDDKYTKYKKHIEELYDKCVNETIKQLIQEGYLLDEKDWNRKTNKIKLTGEKGENRTCECYVNSGIGCVFFTVKDPFYPLNYYINNEKDIPLLSAQIVQLIKEKRTF